MQPKTDEGKFGMKSETARLVRSIRATDRTWDDFGFEADKRRITRADLLELWAANPPAPVGAADAPGEVAIAIAIAHLQKALTLKANAGGAIKAEVRSALNLLT